MAAYAGAEDLVEHVVLAHCDGRPAEPLGELEVFAVFARLAAADRQLRVARTNARELLRHTFRRKPLDDVDEGSSRTNRGELPRIANQDQAMDALECLDQ